MAKSNNFEKIDPIIYEEAARSAFSVGPATLDRLRDIGLVTIGDSPSARCEEMVARAAVAVEIEELKLADTLVSWLCARRDAQPQISLK